MKIQSEKDLIDFGINFAKNLNAAAGPAQAKVIELLGDVGAGKTTFTRGLAMGLGIKEPVTSPSFTISKAYAIPTGGQLIHYDFYRLQDPGIMSEDLQENLENPQNIIVVEWGESIENVLPDNRCKITINITEDGREVLL